MAISLDYQTITFVIGILAIIFSVYNYFRNPQEALDKKQAVDQSTMDGKATILAQQVQWEKEANEKKFAEFGIRLDTAMTLAQNHIHTVDTKCDSLLIQINQLNINVSKLSTIVDERMPRKGV